MSDEVSDFQAERRVRPTLRRVRFSAMLARADNGSNPQGDAAMARKDEPTRDACGMYRRDIGWKPDGKGGCTQHRFYLVRERTVALLRGLLLEKVWAGVEKRWERLGRPAGRPHWDDITLQTAQAAARGDHVAKLDLFGRPLARVDQFHGYLALQRLQDLQPDFPIIRLEAADSKAQEAIPAAEESDREYDRRLAGKGASRDAVLAELDRRPGPDGSQTLHQALDAYAAWIRQNYLAPGGEGRVSQHGATMQTYVGLLE